MVLDSDFATAYYVYIFTCIYLFIYLFLYLFIYLFIYLFNVWQCHISGTGGWDESHSDVDAADPNATDTNSNVLIGRFQFIVDVFQRRPAQPHRWTPSETLWGIGHFYCSTSKRRTSNYYHHPHFIVNTVVFWFNFVSVWWWISGWVDVDSTDGSALDYW